MIETIVDIIFISLLIEAAIWAQGAWMLFRELINGARVHDTVLVEGRNLTAVANEDVRCFCCRILRDDDRVRIRSPDWGR